MIRLIDFRDPAQASLWEPIDDVVMGGRSRSRLEPAGADGARFSGRVSLEYGGGFASVRCSSIPPTTGTGAGLVLHCRGDGNSYKLSLRLDRSLDGIAWQVCFTPSSDVWRSMEFPWSAFHPTYHGRPVSDAPPFEPSRIASIGLLIGDRQEGAFRLELLWFENLTDTEKP